MTERDPLVYLLHMRDFTHEAIDLCAQRRREELDTDRTFGLAVCQLVQLVGGAATKVPADVREGHSDIPWSKIIGMRNRLIHGYNHIDYSIVWETVTVSLPALLPLLDAAIAAESRDEIDEG